MKANPDCLCCFIPPHMLEKILESGSSDQQARAFKILAFGGEMRGRRQALSQIDFPVPHAAQAIKERFVYNSEFGSDLPGKLTRSEGDPPSGDAATDEAYDGAGSTWDLYFQQYGRNSVDGKGMHLISSVHYQQGYDNAFWNGEQMVYGDGDEDLPVNERLFNRFTIAVDVIGHELTHGVTQYEARLDYNDQPGALNESFSDVFGSLVKQKKLNQTVAEADWLIGEGLFTANVKGKAIRSMKAPGTAYDDPVLGKDPQPDHMKKYVKTNSDNGGVHINSGIPNKAFYLTAMGIGGYAWEKAGNIWYVTLRDKLSARSNFQDAARLTYAVAGTLYGKNSPEQIAVKNGWKGVGVNVVTPAKKPKKN
jgi:Zn-dependent metalloprotease